MFKFVLIYTLNVSKSISIVNYFDDAYADGQIHTSCVV